MNFKLFLTSAGLPKETRNYLLSLLNKKPSETNIAFIPTAADPEDDKWFVKAAFDELKEIGFKIRKVDLKNENQNSLLKKLSNSDVIYVNGGNTFYLLDWIRKSGFDQALPVLLNKGKIYLGASAGSLVVGPDIQNAEWEDVNIHDRNIINLKNTQGLSLVPFIISAHFVENDRKVLEKKSKDIDYPVIAINDKQAILCIDGKYEIVGEGKKLTYNKAY